MKQILKITTLLSFGALLFSSCLKDKGFENNEYGINLTDGSPPAVAFADGSKAITPGAITADATPQTVSFVINYTGETPPASDVVVSVVVDNSVIAPYNAANMTAIVPFPAGAITVPTTVTIPAGQRFTNFDVIIPNASLLNPNLQYGVGFKIASVTGGLKIASNKTAVFATFNVKNRYDGVYTVVSGLVTRYTAPGTPANDALSGALGGNPPTYMVTNGPSSIAIPVSGQVGGLYWAVGNNSQVAGIDGITISVNPTTFATTATSTGNATFGNWVGKENRYDPATKTFYLGFRWNPAANVREYEVVLRFLRDR